MAQAPRRPSYAIHSANSCARFWTRSGVCAALFDVRLLAAADGDSPSVTAPARRSRPDRAVGYFACSRVSTRLANFSISDFCPGDRFEELP